MPTKPFVGPSAVATVPFGACSINDAPVDQLSSSSYDEEDQKRRLDDYFDDCDSYQPDDYNKRAYDEDTFVSLAVIQQADWNNYVNQYFGD